ncbi:MAG TPA: hypothetical protein VJQ45_04945 [Ktedonobacterales bacterium]|nr:hypothetical protein [Ktedonobacterales bacterium]
MRPHRVQPALALGALAVVCAAALVSSSAATRMRSAPPRPTVRLSCTVAAPTNPPPEVVNTFTSTLACSVSGANLADRSFAVHYRLGTRDGATNRFDLLCSGPLRRGAGTCTRSFYVPFPFAPSESWATGASLPSGRALGFVVPVPIGPTTTL